jgi:hypothetical protein
MVIEGIFNNWYAELKRKGKMTNCGGSKSGKIQVELSNGTGYHSSFKEANNEYADTNSSINPIEPKLAEQSGLIDIHELLFGDIDNAYETPKLYPPELSPKIIPKFTRDHCDYIYSGIFHAHPGIQIPKSARISPMVYFGNAIIMPSCDNSVPPAIKEAIEIVERRYEDIGEDLIKGDKSHIMVLILPQIQSYIVMFAKLTYYLNMGETKDNHDGIKYRYLFNFILKSCCYRGYCWSFSGFIEISQIVWYIF